MINTHYIFLRSTNNPVELDQIKFLFDINNISYQIKGETALSYGNVESTGISGAEVYIYKTHEEKARKLLIDQQLLVTDKSSFNINKILIPLIILIVSIILIRGIILSYLEY